MYSRRYSQGQTYSLVALVGLLLLIQGCVKLVADYDAKIAQEIISVSKQVDQFYGELLETEESRRIYSEFQKKYITIEVNIRALLIQNKARPLNDESISISETTLEKWIKYKEKHKETNGYKTVLAEQHRKRFTLLFTAMSIAEVAKEMKNEEANQAGEKK